MQQKLELLLQTGYTEGRVDGLSLKTKCFTTRAWHGHRTRAVACLHWYSQVAVLAPASTTALFDVIAPHLFLTSIVIPHVIRCSLRSRLRPINRAAVAVYGPRTQTTASLVYNNTQCQRTGAPTAAVLLATTKSSMTTTPYARQLTTLSEIVTFSP